MAAQFFSSLADNALLVAAIALLMQADAPSWLTPYLKFFFVISYVLLAPYVGAFADRLPKGQVMFLANGVKIFGCVLMLWGVDPLVAYAVVGLGAAAYSPAKYGILTEYLPHRQLVLANGWIEGLTVASIILGTMITAMAASGGVSTFVVMSGRSKFSSFEDTVRLMRSPPSSVPNTIEVTVSPSIQPFATTSL